MGYSTQETYLGSAGREEGENDGNSCLRRLGDYATMGSVTAEHREICFVQ